MKKKINFIFSVLALFFLISSCKKDYNCTCNEISNSQQLTSVVVIPNATSSEASTLCKWQESYIKGYSTDKQCSLD